MAAGPSVELDRAGGGCRARRRRHRARPSTIESARTSAATAVRCAATAGARPSTQTSIRSSSSSPASLRSSWIARCSSRASPSAPELRRQLRVDDDDEALVVGDRGPRSRRCEDLDLVRGERDPGKRHGAVGVDLGRPFPRGGHDRRDRRAELLADLRQQRLDSPLDELRLVPDELDRLDVDLLADRARGARRAPAGRRPAGRARAWRAAGGP